MVLKSTIFLTVLSIFELYVRYVDVFSISMIIVSVGNYFRKLLSLLIVSHSVSANLFMRVSFLVHTVWGFGVCMCLYTNESLFEVSSISDLTPSVTKILI